MARGCVTQTVPTTDFTVAIGIAGRALTLMRTDIQWHADTNPCPGYPYHVCHPQPTGFAEGQIVDFDIVDDTPGHLRCTNLVAV